MLLLIDGIADNAINLGSQALNTPVVVLLAVAIMALVYWFSRALSNQSKSHTEQIQLFNNALAGSAETNRTLLDVNAQSAVTQDRLGDNMTAQSVILERIQQQQIQHDSFMIAQNDGLVRGLAENRRDHEEIKGQVTIMTDFVSGVVGIINDMQEQISEMRQDIQALKISEEVSTASVTELTQQMISVTSALNALTEAIKSSKNDVQ